MFYLFNVLVTFINYCTTYIHSLVILVVIIIMIIIIILPFKNLNSLKLFILLKKVTEANPKGVKVTKKKQTNKNKQQVDKCHLKKLKS